MATRYHSRVTQKGQVTIPVEIRRLLELETGDRVEFEVENGAVRIRPAQSRLLAGYGAVTPHSRPEDFRSLREEAEHIIADEARRRARDS